MGRSQAELSWSKMLPLLCDLGQSFKTVQAPVPQVEIIYPMGIT